MATTAAHKPAAERGRAYFKLAQSYLQREYLRTHAAQRKKISGYPVDRFTSPCGTSCTTC